jgi:hypothetical protein
MWRSSRIKSDPPRGSKALVDGDLVDVARVAWPSRFTPAFHSPRRVGGLLLLQVFLVSRRLQEP